MKPVGPLLLVLAGLVLGWIALSTDPPTYSVASAPPIPDVVPVSLSGELPSGCVVRSFDVEGMCCKGCVGKLFVALDELEEVREAAVDFTHAKAEVVVPEGLDPERVARALTFDKYSTHLSGAVSHEGPEGPDGHRRRRRSE